MIDPDRCCLYLCLLGASLCTTGCIAQERAGLTVSLDIPRTVTEGDRVPVVMRVANRDPIRRLSFFRPSFDESIGNVSVQVFRLEKAGEREVDFAYRRSAGGAVYDDQHRVTLAPKERASYTLSLARYFKVKTPGRYRLKVDLHRVEGASATALFSVAPRKVAAAKQFEEKRDPNAPPREDGWPDQDKVMHKALLLKLANGFVKLIYEADLRGFKGSILVDRAKDIRDFEVVHLRRDIPGDGRITYDDHWRLRRHKVPVMLRAEEGAQSLVTQCHYVAVVYRKGDSVFLWTRGEYGPGPEMIHDDAVARDEWDPNTVIAANVKIAGGVTRLIGVGAKKGLVRVTYVDKGGKTRTICVDECGKEQPVGGTSGKKEKGGK